MPLGYFQRTATESFKIRFKLDEPPRIIKQGDIVHVDFNTYKDVAGFKFVGWDVPHIDPGISTNPSKPTTLYNGSELNIVGVQAVKQAPHKTFIEERRKRQESISNEPITVVKCIEEISLPEKKVEEPVIKPEVAIETNKEALITLLKKYTSKHWFIMQKHKAKEYMERLGVDYSMVPNIKTDLIKVLKKYIESLSD